MTNGLAADDSTFSDNLMIGALFMASCNPLLTWQSSSESRPSILAARSVTVALIGPRKSEASPAGMD